MNVSYFHSHSCCSSFSSDSVSTSTEGNEGQAPQDSQEVSSEQNGATSEQLKVAINFSGSYESLKKFISSVQNYERKIVITNITISSKSQEELTGVMNLEFHAVPKLSDEDMEYLIWTLNNVYGKDILFSSGAASGAYASTIEEQNNKKDINDFVMMLRSSLSELPTVTIGRAKDESRESYIYSDNDKVEEVEMSFDEANGKTYYKYKAAGSYYPKDNSSEGKEFTSKSEDKAVNPTSGSAAKSAVISSIKSLASFAFSLLKLTSKICVSAIVITLRFSKTSSAFKSILASFAAFKIRSFVFITSQ